MTGDVQLPDMIDPDAAHVEFRATQCRECGEAGPVALKTNPTWWQWGDDHSTATGHTKIFQWTLTRNSGEIVNMSTRRKPTRRALGARGQ
jgi:hypothetical protein